jgi:transposase
MDAVLPSITTLDQARACITTLNSQLSCVTDENQQLRWRVQQLEKQLYGTSSESAPVEQTLSKEQILLSLFPPPAEPPAVQQALVLNSEEDKPARPRRQPAARVLETVTERIEPAEKVCPHCQSAKCEIGCEKSERFEYRPAKIIRHEIIRPKLACPCGQGTVSIAPLAASVVPGGLPGASLVAHVLLSKYDDHLPLYRQQQQLARLGVHFARQTLCDWIEKGAELLQPLVREMKRQLLAGDYVQVDETPVRVMDPEVKARCANGYLWVMGRPGSDVIFEFHPGRGKEYASKLLGNFAGYLQRDGYGVYGALAAERPQIQPVGCWAHARRKFVEALDEWPQEAGSLVTEIRKLYLIEQHARGLPEQERWTLRQSHSLPILIQLKPRLQQIEPRCLPQSPLGKAVRYTLNEWHALERYTTDGRLEIDNNLTENAIRPTAVGKKNWLFIGHPDAGWRSAVIYSVIISCRRRGIDAWEYVSEMLQRLPAAKANEIPDLVPGRWSPARSP